MKILKFKKTKEERLYKLLEKAANTVERLNDDSILSEYDSGIHMANFLRSSILDFKSGKITKENKLKLWQFFAPTSEWDDIGGKPSLGNKILELINQVSTKT